MNSVHDSIGFHDARTKNFTFMNPKVSQIQHCNDNHLSMRKHRSLDGSQFLDHFDSKSVPSISKFLTNQRIRQTNELGDFQQNQHFNYDGNAINFANNSQPQAYYNFAYTNRSNSFNKYPKISSFQSYSQPSNLFKIEKQPSYTINPASQRFLKNYPEQQETPLFLRSEMYRAPSQLSYGNDYTNDYELLKREYAIISQKLNYAINSIQTFWSPELKKERQLRKEEGKSINALQVKLSQQESEIEIVKNELKKREKDIGQILSESDLVDMEEEFCRLRKQFFNEELRSNGNGELRKCTDNMPLLHELQTKIKRSELILSEKNLVLVNCEVRLKCAEEQNAELEKRNEILARSSAANEAHLKLLHDDLNVLRKKLETKNQLLENREKSIKSLENELESCKTKAQEHLQSIIENEHRIVQLSYRIDELETSLREKNMLVDSLKQRLMQSPNARAETELQQKLENADKDKICLEKTIDTLRQSSEIEKHNQFEAFENKTQQLRSTIDHMQKELADRHVLIASQNEKIFQLDSELGNNVNKYIFDTMSNTSSARNNLNEKSELQCNDKHTLLSSESAILKSSNNSNIECISELDEARNEIERLLCIVHRLENDKSLLNSRLKNYNNTSLSQYDDCGGFCMKHLKKEIECPEFGQMSLEPLLQISDALEFDSKNSSCKSENNSMKLRIEALEEALRESVGITSERDCMVNNQKQLIQQLANQVTDLYKSCGGKDLQKSLQNAITRAENAEKALFDACSKFQRQVSSLRKEIVMAVICEKEACIQLIQNPPDSTKQKLEILLQQKEQLKHHLLTISGRLEAKSVQENFDADFITLEAIKHITGIEQKANSTTNLHSKETDALFNDSNLQRNLLQNQNNVFCPNLQLNNAYTLPHTSMIPININLPSYNSSIRYSAPASLNYAKNDNFEDDGIWA